MAPSSLTIVLNCLRYLTKLLNCILVESGTYPAKINETQDDQRIGLTFEAEERR